MDNDLFEQSRRFIRDNRYSKLFNFLREHFKTNSDKNFIDNQEGIYREWKHGDMSGINYRDDPRLNQVRMSLLNFISKKEEEVDNKNSLLFIGASPEDEKLGPLDITTELAIIKSLMADHEYLKVESILNAKKTDLLKNSLKFRPKILHLACHSNEMGFFLEAENGSKKKSFLNLDDFLDFISRWNRTIDCVILNSCSSKIIGEKISEYIPHVIVTNQNIKDNASIEYSKGFYTWVSIENEIKPNYSKAHLAGKKNLNFLNLSDEWTVEYIHKINFNKD